MKSNRKAFLGVLLVLVGILLLLDNLHVIPHLPRYFFSWPSLIIVIGLINLVLGNRSAALVFIAIGGFFLLQRYFYLDFRTYWPVILVIIGLAILLRRSDLMTHGSGEIGDKYFDEVNIFGGSMRRFTSQSLEGGKVTNIFGGSDIDLREASPVDGAIIEVFTLFGGSKIIVPPHWDVNIQTTAIFGAFEDKRERAAAKSDYKIYIKGFVMFGGGELKSTR